MIHEPVSFLPLVAFELLFGEHVVRDDVLSLAKLVPLGHEQENDEEYESHKATHCVKHPLDVNFVIKDLIQNDENTSSGNNDSAN